MAHWVPWGVCSYSFDQKMSFFMKGEGSSLKTVESYSGLIKSSSYLNLM